jgi:outer membrane protein
MRSPNTWLRIGAAFALLLALVVPVGAESPQMELGLGVGMVPDYEGSDDYEAVPLLHARVGWDSGRYVNFTGNVLAANLLAGDTWELGPMVQLIGERDDVDSDAVDAMEEVDTSVMTGIFGRWKIGDAYLRAHALQDLADGNDGFVFQVGGGWNWRMSPTFRMTLDVFTTWADDDYMEAYFEVDAADALRSGLPAYGADSGFKDLGVNLTTRCSPWEHWNFLGLFGYSRLVEDAEDSPVVDDEGDANQFRAGLIVVYDF